MKIKDLKISKEEALMAYDIVFIITPMEYKKYNEQ